MTNKNWHKKYPDVFDGGQISLRELANVYMIYKSFKKVKDYDSLKLLGLIDYEKDLKCMLDPNWLRKEELRKERKEKLNKLNNL